MKKILYRRKKFELVSSTIKKSFEKNPINGGTPAIENNKTVTVKRKKGFKLKPVKEWRVLKLELTRLNSVQNKIVKERLYINM